MVVEPACQPGGLFLFTHHTFVPVENPPALGRYLEKGGPTHSSILAWEIPWTGEPGGLQSMGLRRAGHDRD